MRAVWVAVGVVGVVVAALWMQRHVFSFGSSRLAVVTGANRGLGRAIGHELNLHFADIGTVLCARKIRDAEEASASASTPKRCAACEVRARKKERKKKGKKG
jgi:NADP-dependent 3-hydroxy acid dehydrogenase YdfG